MTISSIDHLYAETSDWKESVAFWEGLGFAFAEQWGSEGHRAGRLKCGSAVVVLAEVTDRTPEFNVYFAVDDDPEIPAAVAVVDATHDTHWGTRLTRVADPDGRVFGLERRP